MSEHSPLFGGSADEKVISAAEGRTLANIAEAVARWAVSLSFLLIPLAYMPGTVDALELPKQTILIVLTVVATVAWLGKMLVNRKAELRRSPMHLLVLVYLAFYALSTWFSKSRYVSLAGDYGQEKAGLATLGCLVLLYFVAVNVWRDAKDIGRDLRFLLLGGAIVLVQGYLQTLGLRFLPGTAAQSSAFNLVGTSNALGVYAAMMLSLIMGMFLMPDRAKWGFLRKALMGILAALSVVYVAALSFWSLWVTLIVASLLLVVYGMVKTDKVSQVTMLSIPMAAVVIGTLFIFIDFPVRLGLPAEVMPSLRATWSISREALASAPLFGSGPGTFLYDYVQFRSQDLNSTSFWSVPFDRGSSRLLTLLATTGILGLAAAAVMVVFLLVRTALKLARGREDWLMTLTVFSGWTALLVARVLYSSNLTLEFLFWMLTAALVALEWHERREVRFESSPRAALLSSFFFIVAIIVSVAGLYLQGQRYVAEKRYTKGVTMALNSEADVDAAVAHLLRASQLNAGSDLYLRTLSQALALQANLAARKAGDKPSDDDIRRIAVLAANAVNAGKRATDLSPSDVRNWSSLAGMYRDLGASTPGATEAAEAAYKKAIELEPVNPIYYTELGRISLGQADSEVAKIRGRKDVKDDEKAAAQRAAEDHLGRARGYFDKAVELKTDYAPAHYWIAVILERQGKTKEALAKLESVRNYNPRDLGVGFQLAILYYQNDEKDKAMAELERIIKLSPSYSNARWYLAAMYEEKGRLDDAIVQIEEVLKYNKDSQDVMARLEGLKAKKSGAAPEGEGLPEPVETPASGEVIKK
jgi:tetratricopeptide (TPR) repeat protein